MKNIWQKIKRPILALAPMAGYTDPAFRIMCLKHGADIVYTEMISVEAIWRKNTKTLNMLKLLPQEKNVILQLFGNKPESFAKALQVINDLRKSTGSLRSPFGFGRDKLSGIDINFGCPAHKVIKTGSGAVLMNNKKIAREITKTVLNNTNLPVSIKIRSQVKNTSALEFIEFIKDLPISAVMIHGRSLQQDFSGKIDFNTIKKIKELLPHKIILANGGIYNSQDAKKTLEKTNADGLGIARGAWGRPWIFSTLSRATTSLRGGVEGSREKKPNLKFVRKQMLQHAKLFLKQQKMCDYEQNFEPLRKHLLLYCKGQPHASELRQKIIKIKNLKELKKALQ